MLHLNYAQSQPYFYGNRSYLVQDQRQVMVSTYNNFQSPQALHTPQYFQSSQAFHTPQSFQSPQALHAPQYFQRPSFGFGQQFYSHNSSLYINRPNPITLVSSLMTEVFQAAANKIEEFLTPTVPAIPEAKEIIGLSGDALDNLNKAGLVKFIDLGDERFLAVTDPATSFKEDFSIELRKQVSELDQATISANHAFGNDLMRAGYEDFQATVVAKVAESIEKAFEEDGRTVTVDDISPQLIQEARIKLESLDNNSIAIRDAKISLDMALLYPDTWQSGKPQLTALFSSFDQMFDQSSALPDSFVNRYQSAIDNLPQDGIYDPIEARLGTAEFASEVESKGGLTPLEQILYVQVAHAPFVSGTANSDEVYLASLASNRFLLTPGYQEAQESLFSLAMADGSLDDVNVNTADNLDRVLLKLLEQPSSSGLSAEDLDLMTESTRQASGLTVEAHQALLDEAIAGAKEGVPASHNEPDEHLVESPSVLLLNSLNDSNINMEAANGILSVLQTFLDLFQNWNKALPIHYR